MRLLGFLVLSFPAAILLALQRALALHSSKLHSTICGSCAELHFIGRFLVPDESTALRFRSKLCLIQYVFFVKVQSPEAWESFQVRMVNVEGETTSKEILNQSILGSKSFPLYHLKKREQEQRDRTGAVCQYQQLVF